MNKTFYILLFFFLRIICKAQTGLNTIIPNPDFELYDSCPNANSQLYVCKGWYNPTLATPDYYNACSGVNTGVSIPKNGTGYQYAYSGNGYCGIFPYWDGLGTCDYREYLQAKLNYPLHSGKNYHLEFFVSFADIYSGALKKMAALFTSFPITRTDVCPIIANPQIVNTKGYLMDTLNWMKIEGDFIAQGGEEYITIGDFENNSAGDILPLMPDSVTLGSHNMYYYIDGIHFTEGANEVNTANFFTPNNDGINDVFYISGIEPEDTYQIYNRWGIKVFDGGYNIGWDGNTTAGLNCTEGVYYFVVETKSNIKKKGFIQLIR